MAEEAQAPAPVGDVKPTEEITPVPEAPAESTAAEATSTAGGDAAGSGGATEATETSSPKPDAAADANAAADNSADVTATPNGASASAKAAGNNRRKSGAGVPEHKKKTPSKKKGAVEARLNLNAKPGDMYLVSMKGYPPWPVIVCDEEMLPETLLMKRPVSAQRIDGTYREDFAEGGKHVKDRRYPIMFLGTNEFAWEVNTALQPLDIDAVKKEVATGNTLKKKKALWEAFEIAAQEHDLQHFKDVLNEHEKAMAADVEERAAVEVKKQETKEKKKRKSLATVEDDDVDMEDAEDDDGETPAKKKQTKKRKKTDESEGEGEKPAKTPKTKLKLTHNAKDSPAAKPKATKAKKGKKTDSEESESASASTKPEEKPMTEAERREKQEKSVLYLRHRLQKGFLARDHAPREEEMAEMSGHLKQLEDLKNLEAETIRKTKVHKVLRAILKLPSIPKEEEYGFKKRSTTLLQSWTGALQSEEAAAPAPAATAAAAPATNGIEKTEEKKEEAATSAEKTEEASPAVEAPKAAKAMDEDGDALMTDVKPEGTGEAEATAPEADASKTATEVALEVAKS